MVEEILVVCAIMVSYEPVRQWVLKFGYEITNNFRRRALRRDDNWHLDEVVLTIGGNDDYSWRVSDQNSHRLDAAFSQTWCVKIVAKLLLRKHLKKQSAVQRVMMTDMLKNYIVTNRYLMPGVEHCQHKDFNNRAENSRQMTQRQKWQIKRITSVRERQRFLSIHEPIVIPSTHAEITRPFADY